MDEYANWQERNTLYIDSIAKVAEKLRNEEAARYMYEDDANKAVVKYCSDFYNAYIQKKPDVMRLMIAEDIKREWAIMDACNTTATIRDVQKATIVNKMIETYGISLPKDIVANLPNEIHSKYLRKLLTDANQKLIDYEQQKETEQPALQDNRPLESMTDGRDIFERVSKLDGVSVRGFMAMLPDSDKPPEIPCAASCCGRSLCACIF